MRKTTIRIVLLLILLTGTATQCDVEEYNTLPGSVIGVSIRHWDNAGKSPKRTIDKIKKEAYLLEVAITTDGEHNIPAGNRSGHHTWTFLEDPITRVNVYTIHRLNEEFPAGADISSCFKEYSWDMQNRIEDSTRREYPISDVYSEFSLYKALFTSPEPGMHQFRVVLTFASERTLETVSEPIEFY